MDGCRALKAIVSKPFGYLLPRIITIGLAGLALWRLVQAAGARLELTEGGSTWWCGRSARGQAVRRTSGGRRADCGESLRG
jgi:hypothetical protein